VCVCPYMHASVCMLICCTRFWHATALRKMQLASSYSGRHLFVQRLSSFLLLYGMRAKAILAITETQPLQKQSLLSQRRRDPCFAACKSNPCYHREAEILALLRAKAILAITEKQRSLLLLRAKATLAITEKRPLHISSPFLP